MAARSTEKWAKIQLVCGPVQWQTEFLVLTSWQTAERDASVRESVIRRRREESLDRSPPDSPDTADRS